MDTKQIFCYMREQIGKEYNHYMEMADYTEDEELRAFKHGVSKGLDMAYELINEAEAKWETEKNTLENYRKEIWEQQLQEYGKNTEEAECCEWHFAKGGYYKTVVASPHKEFISLKTSDLKSQPYCGHCGKPIKISEVE